MEGLRTVRRSSHEQEIRAGYNDEQWQLAEKAALAVAGKLSPPTSGAKFIAARKDPSSEERLAIAEWFREFVDGAGSSDGPVMVIDPYFDEWGLDLIAASQRAGRKYLVVTTTRGPHDDTVGRAQRLRAAFSARQPLMEGLKVEVFMVHHKRLHDRYVLVLDGEGRPLRGGHLSNSLQAGAQTYPLLITPIPADTLDLVADSVVEMVEDAEPLDLRPGRESPEPQPKPEEERSREELEELASQVSGDTTFPEAWSTYARARASTVQPRAFGEWVKDRGWIEPLAVLLKTAKAPVSPHGPGIQELMSTAQAATRSLLHQRNLDRVWTHGHRMLVSDWSTCFGYQALLAGDPTEFVSLMDKDSRFPRPTGSAEVDAGFRLHMALDALREHGFRLRSDPEKMRTTVGAMLSSKSDFVRALGGAWLGLEMLGGAEQTLEPDSARSLLDILSATDRLLVVSEWIGDLRVRANRRDGQPDAEEESLRELLMKWLQESWPEEAISKELLRQIVARCEGPSMGSWAVSTTNELLLPLVATKISLEHVADLWLGLLLERLRKIESGKYHFSLWADARLSDVCAWLIAISTGAMHDLESSLKPDPTTRASVLNYVRHMDRVRKSSARNVSRPFVRSLQYSIWDGSNRSLAWLEGIARLSLRIDPSLVAVSGEYLDRWVSVGQRLTTPEADDPSGLHRWLLETRKLGND